MKPIVIVGAGGHGRETALLVAQINAVTPTWEILGFLDDDPARWGTTVGAHHVLGDLASLGTLPARTAVALGVGAPRSKRAICARIPRETPLPALVHPSVLVGERVRIGDGTQLHAGTILTSDIRLGHGVTVNRHCDVSHDDVLGDFVTLAPGVSLAGDVQLADDVVIGIRASCIPGVRVGAGAVIGAGAVVVRNVSPGVTAVGVPARPLGVLFAPE